MLILSFAIAGDNVQLEGLYGKEKAVVGLSKNEGMCGSRCVYVMVIWRSCSLTMESIYGTAIFN